MAPDLNNLQSQLQNIDKEQLKNEFLFKWAQIKPYLLNIKTIFGIAVIIFAIYTSFEQLPKKWGEYQQTINQGKQLEAKKQSLQTEEAKLKAITEELQKLEVKPLKIAEGSSPQLSAISTAQKVVELSDSFQNTYVSLTPSPESVVLTVDSYVTLPLGGAAESSGPKPPQKPNRRGKQQKAVEAGPGDFNAFKYTLQVQGSYVNIVSFIHQLALSKDFIIIQNIELKPAGIDPMNPEGGPLVDLKLEFLVPWH